MQLRYQGVAAEISKAFNGKPVRVELCDQMLTVKKKLPTAREPAGKN